MGCILCFSLTSTCLFYLFLGPTQTNQHQTAFPHHIPGLCWSFILPQEDGPLFASVQSVYLALASLLPSSHQSKTKQNEMKQITSTLSSALRSGSNPIIMARNVVLRTNLLASQSLLHVYLQDFKCATKILETVSPTVRVGTLTSYET